MSTWILRPVLSTVKLWSVRGRCSAPRSGDVDQVKTLLQLCVDRYFISPGQTNTARFRRGMSCNYGPLGMELRRNLLEQWWRSVNSSRDQVFGISTVSSSVDGDGDTGDGGGHLRMVEAEVVEQMLQREDLSKEQIIQELQTLLQTSPPLRRNLLQGALLQFVPMLELVNRKLPFGLAEVGLCFEPSDGSCRPTEFTQTSLVWFCSPRTSSQWLDHWTRQRLKWWRKFSLSPSGFSSSNVPGEEVIAAASRGVRILYNFPWGQEVLETLWSRGDAELLHVHNGNRAKLQCRNERRALPQVLSITGNVDCGLMAFLFNSLQQLEKKGGKQRLQHRKVLKLHPVLTPIKVALDTGTGATAELRQVCEGLLHELLETKITVWPGYRESAPTSIEQLFAKYDEMGVLFSVVITEDTLETGLLQVRSRDTTIKETMHISTIKSFLTTYISAAERI